MMFLELKKVLLLGGTFLFLRRRCVAMRPRWGRGRSGGHAVSAGDPSTSSGITLRLLLRVSPSETSCSFTPTGFIYSVYLYQGFTPLPVVYHSYGVYYKIICCEWIYLLFNVRYITDEMWMDMIKKMLSRVMDSAFFLLILSSDLCFAEVVDAVLEGFDFGFGIGLFFALVLNDFGFGIGYEFFVAELFHYRI